MTAPTHKIGPFSSWNKKKIVSIDPFGHDPTHYFKEYYEKGYDIRPTIAVTLAHMEMPEIKQAMLDGHVKADGKILEESGKIHVLKAACEPGMQDDVNSSQYGRTIVTNFIPYFYNVFI